MDIQLPIMDGYTDVLSGEEKKARAVGCDDYVPKPFSPRQLLPKIRQ
jgi:two-component system, cell cycle response regulator DivK